MYKLTLEQQLSNVIERRRAIDEKRYRLQLESDNLRKKEEKLKKLINNQRGNLQSSKEANASIFSTAEFIDNDEL